MSIAQYNVGLAYLKGDGTEQDATQAIRYLQLAAEQGDFPAQYQLANCHFDGRGVPKDSTKGETWLTQAATGGYAPAQYALAHHLFLINNKKDAIQWLETAAAQNEPQAVFTLAIAYLNGFNVQKDVKKAIKLFNQVPDEPFAKFCLTQIHNKTLAPLSDLPTAHENFQRYQFLMQLKSNADAGDAEARVRLGSIYYAGEEVSPDDTKAIRYWDLAANQGHLPAQYLLLLHYLEQAPDLTKARHYLELIEANRDSKELSGENLSLDLKVTAFCAFGIHCRNDAEEAKKWLHKAIDSTEDPTSKQFARFCLNQLGKIDNLNKAFESYKELQALIFRADNGDAEAQLLLASDYLTGNLVDKDLSRAINYLTLSATQNNLLAQCLLVLHYLEQPINEIQAQYYLGLVETNPDSAVLRGGDLLLNSKSIVFCAFGIHRRNDVEEAKKWFNKAIESTEEPISKRFAQFCLNQLGKIDNLEKAVESFSASEGTH